MLLVGWCSAEEALSGLDELKLREGGGLAVVIVFLAVLEQLPI